MSQPTPSDVTRLLADAQAGHPEAMERLLPVVYDELRGLARRQRFRHRPYETLNTTALVHEAFLKLAGRDGASWENRLHFYRIASRAMRDILVDYARRQRAGKRGGGQVDASLDEVEEISGVDSEEVLGVADALERLESLDPRQGKIVELRYFVGLTVPETAEVLGISPATVKREWATARAWLQREIDRSP